MKVKTFSGDFEALHTVQIDTNEYALVSDPSITLEEIKAWCWEDTRNFAESMIESEGGDPADEDEGSLNETRRIYADYYIDNVRTDCSDCTAERTLILYANNFGDGIHLLEVA